MLLAVYLFCVAVAMWFLSKMQNQNNHGDCESTELICPRTQTCLGDESKKNSSFSVFFSVHSVFPWLIYLFWYGLNRAGLLTSNIVNFFTKFSDQRERTMRYRAVAQIGWRLCRPGLIRG